MLPQQRRVYIVNNNSPQNQLLKLRQSHILTIVRSLRSNQAAITSCEISILSFLYIVCVFSEFYYM